MEQDVAVLQNIAETLKDEPHASQRTLAKNAGMSLGMMNAILGRFVERGWIMLTNVNLKKLSYAITPDGVAELVGRGRRFAKRTFEIANQYNDALYCIIKAARDSGKTKVVLCGNSYIRFMIAYVCSQLEIELEESEIDSAGNFNNSLVLVGEQEEEALQKKVLDKVDGSMSVLDIMAEASVGFVSEKPEAI